VRNQEFTDALKSKRRIDQEERTAVKEMRNELYKAKKAYPKNGEIQEVIEMASLVGLTPSPPRGPRRRKEHVKTGVERQRAYRERMREQGYRQVLVWVKDK